MTDNVVYASDGTMVGVKRSGAHAPDSDASLNIYQRVQRVMQEVAYVKKDKEVENYMAVTHDQVTAMVRPHFVRWGIAVQPTVISATMIDTTRKSRSGNPAMRYEGRFQIDFVNIDRPEDRIAVQLDAHADDYGDKAPGKALSYAVKYAILKLLLLETGENDEGRLAPPAPELSTVEADALEDLYECAGKGLKALEEAWGKLNKTTRVALKLHLPNLKEAAGAAEKQTGDGNAN